MSENVTVTEAGRGGLWARLSSLTMLRRLTVFVVLWTFALIMLGAWVRLHDAGLGCPDWPGCYGHLTPTHASEHIEAAAALNPDGPVTAAKAWKEMIHRYVAGVLLLAVAAIVALWWKHRRVVRVPAGLPLTFAAVLIFQALLGKWTVTLLLKPVVVTGHLLGGLSTLALLAWFSLCVIWPRPLPVKAPRVWIAVALLLVAIQIGLGGWTSTNYAALACNDFPACFNGQWVPPMDFGNAFHIVRELGKTAEGDPLSLEALMAIHWLHRLGAIVVAVLVGGLGVALLRRPALRVWGGVLLGVLALQIALGIANVVLSLPLWLAVAHNGGAALLLLVCVALNYRVWRTSGESA